MLKPKEAGRQSCRSDISDSLRLVRARDLSTQYDEKLCTTSNIPPISIPANDGLAPVSSDASDGVAPSLIDINDGVEPSTAELSCDGPFPQSCKKHEIDQSPACECSKLTSVNERKSCNVTTRHLQSFKRNMDEIEQKYRLNSSRVVNHCKCSTDQQRQALLPPLETCSHVRNHSAKCGVEYLEEIQNLRVGQSNLKKKIARFQILFLILAGISIILVVCILIALPTILITMKMMEIPESKIADITRNELQSEASVHRVKRVLFCIRCSQVPHLFKDGFHKGASNGECCIEDISSLFNVISDNNAKVTNLETAIKDLSLLISPSNNSESFNITNIQHRIHSRVDKLDDMLSILLHQKRAAIHLRSKGLKDQMPKWEIETANNIELHQNKVHLTTAGLYFIYSGIRFKENECGSGSTFGYQIKGSIGHQSIASISQECSIGGENIKQYLFIQTLHFFRQKNTMVYIDLDMKSKSFLHDGDEHYFGAFQI